MDNKKIMIGIIATLIISIIGLGIAFAAFSRNLVITVSNKAFQNFDGAYYIFEEKSFITLFYLIFFNYYDTIIHTLWGLYAK